MVHGFNPTLVRFCPAAKAAAVARPATFQSHLGSILPRLGSGCSRLAQRVSIPPWFDFARYGLQPGNALRISFNPTLVRFCLMSSPGGSVSDPGFQSHLGSILPRRSRDMRLLLFRAFQSHLGSILPGVATCPGGGRRTRFQSHLGSILPVSTSATRLRPVRVSIPPWFDFAARRTPCTLPHAVVSIPPWFDFAAARPTTLWCPLPFQSHLGSILPMVRYKVMPYPHQPFQSHLGSILPIYNIVYPHLNL